jgi:hypothetical protein
MKKLKRLAKRVSHMYSQFNSHRGFRITIGVRIGVKTKTAQPTLVPSRLARAQSNNFSHAVTGASVLLLFTNWRFGRSNTGMQ